MRVVVGRVGRAHGLRGEVTVQPRTDDPQGRFGSGAELYPVAEGSARTAAGWPAALHVAGSRWQSGRMVVRFHECPDRAAVEALAGALLEAEVDVLEQADPDEFHDLALIGLVVQDQSGAQLGVVSEVVHLPAQDLLVVAREPAQAAVEVEPLLVPFVKDLVPLVDIAGGRLVVELPAGMLEPPPASPDTQRS